MTKKGYTHIIISTNLHNKLKQLSKQANISMSKFIERSINARINTDLHDSSYLYRNSLKNGAQNKHYSSNAFSVNAFAKRVDGSPEAIRSMFREYQLHFLFQAS